MRAKPDAPGRLSNTQDKRGFSRDGRPTKNTIKLTECRYCATSDVHAADEIKDFGIWIREALGDDKLADDLLDWTRKKLDQAR